MDHENMELTLHSDILSLRDPAAQHPKTAKVTSCCAPLRKVAASALHPGYRGASFLSQPPTTHPSLTITYRCQLTIHSCGQLPTVAWKLCFHISSLADPPGAVALSWPVEAHGPVMGPQSTLVPKPAWPYQLDQSII